MEHPFQVSDSLRFLSPEKKIRGIDSTYFSSHQSLDAKNINNPFIEALFKYISKIC